MTAMSAGGFWLHLPRDLHRGAGTQHCVSLISALREVPLSGKSDIYPNFMCSRRVPGEGMKVSKIAPVLDLLSLSTRVQSFSEQPNTSYITVNSAGLRASSELLLIL